MDTQDKEKRKLQNRRYYLRKRIKTLIELEERKEANILQRELEKITPSTERYVTAFGIYERGDDGYMRCIDPDSGHGHFPNGKGVPIEIEIGTLANLHERYLAGDEKPCDIAKSADLTWKQLSRQFSRHGFWVQPRKKPYGPDDEFIEVWNKSNSARVVADHYGVSVGAVIGKASRMRKKGMELKKLSRWGSR